jgi:hypothetical protein
MTFTSGPSAISEVRRFERPNFWQLRGGSKILRSGLEGRVTPSAAGAHLTLRMELRLRGPLGLALPLVRRRMQRELERDIGAIKATLEGPDRPLGNGFVSEGSWENDRAIRESADLGSTEVWLHQSVGNGGGVDAAADDGRARDCHDPTADAR